jgi:uncharacterized membrane protein AbrB (regulator of aidB expression)
VGVEAGQLVFVFAVLIMISGLKTIKIKIPAWSNKVPAYFIGTLSMYWFIERVVAVI